LHSSDIKRAVAFFKIPFPNSSRFTCLSNVWIRCCSEVKAFDFGIIPYFSNLSFSTQRRIAVSLIFIAVPAYRLNLFVKFRRSIIIIYLI